MRHSKKLCAHVQIWLNQHLLVLMSRDLHCDHVRSWLLSGTWYDTVDSLWFAAKRIIYYGYIPTVIYLGVCDLLSMHARRHSNRSPRLATRMVAGCPAALGQAARDDHSSSRCCHRMAIYEPHRG